MAIYIERPTSNFERRTERGFALPFDVRRRMFDVGCSSGFIGNPDLQFWTRMGGHEPGKARRAGFQPAALGGIPAAQVFCGQGCPQNRQPRWLPYERTVPGKQTPPRLDVSWGHEPLRLTEA